MTKRMSGVAKVAGIGMVAALALTGCAKKGEVQTQAAAGEPQPGTLAYDMSVWHSLLENNTKLRRLIKHLDNGIEATTVSDDPEIAAKIIDHGKAMQSRIERGARVRVWDPVFRELFENHKNVKLEVTVLPNGVKIVETSEDPTTLLLMRSHAMGVSEFVREGFAASGRETPKFRNSDPLPVAEAAIGGVPHRFLLGQPTAEHLLALRQSGAKGVLSFRKEAELKGFDEKGAAGSVGMEYCSVPWAGAAELTDEVFAAGREAFRKAAGEKLSVVVHCRTGNRVGPVWAAYRVLDEGVGMEQAIAEAKMVGMTDAAFEPRVRGYVESQKR